jgi:hypothetical protein
VLLSCCCSQQSGGLSAFKCDAWLRAVRVLETQHRWERPGKRSKFFVDVSTMLDAADATNVLLDMP